MHPSEKFHQTATGVQSQKRLRLGIMVIESRVTAPIWRLRKGIFGGYGKLECYQKLVDRRLID